MIPFNILEVEVQIKLIEYLKNNKYMNEKMYDYIIGKFLKKLEYEKHYNLIN